MRRHILILVALGSLGACSDNSVNEDSSELFAQISQTSAMHVGAGLVHYSEFGPDPDGSTSCGEWDSSVDERQLRENYSAQGSQACRTTDGGGSECLTAQTYPDGSLFYSVHENKGTNPGSRTMDALLSFRSDGVFHRFGLVAFGARVFWFFGTGNGREDCVSAESAAYGPDDVSGAFALKALKVGDALEMEEVATDIVSCTSSGCTNQDGSLKLDLPSRAFSEMSQGYDSAAATIAGESYNSMLGSFSPRHDYASFLACPQTWSTYDFAAECLFILAERIAQ